MLAAALLAAGTAQAEIRVVDDYGGTVTLPAPARRVVSLAPHLTELLYAAGAGGRLVGALEYSDYPPAAQGLPRVGSEAQIDLEALIALKPDLVVAWPQSGSKRTIDRIEDLGVPLYRSEPRELEDIARTLERLGTLTGAEASAREAARRFRARVARLQATYASRPTVRVFYQVWNAPLITVSGAHVISKVLRLCGGENVMSDLPAIAPEIDRERVLRTDPEAIIASGSDGRHPQWLREWHAFPTLAAARLNNLYAVPPALVQRHTPRLLDGAEEICSILEEVRGRRTR